jgi:hypothetical protein
VLQAGCRQQQAGTLWVTVAYGACGLPRSGRPAKAQLSLRARYAWLHPRNRLYLLRTH